ncbi:hypothetical protein WG954_00505 [Lacibacter sp. H375]|uniref:Uncharacterized protein n=1 Tax=Lacibacter sediminis TaxID=2760713 RepID=A0A7G5XDV9_9BACT|nr:hypothetical protein [Lacibacter sediminis]QNA43662.1 hypothetical protein H4075_16480 [Lacibacter sediminis]
MEKKSSALNWILFFVSVAACVIFYFTPAFANYITATFPFICYYFVKALDLI